MDLSVAQTTLYAEEEDEWDTEGFVIPSLELEDKVSDSEIQTSKPPSPTEIKAEENIYLGPHGAPPSQREGNPSNRKQRFKQKLKEADQKMSGSGRENKVAHLRELVGGTGKSINPNLSKGSSRDWLDPHCHESQFEKRPP